MSELLLEQNVKCQTLIQSLQETCENTKTHQGILYIDDKGIEEWISYPDLLNLAATHGKGLYESGVRAGDRVGIVLPTCKTFLGAFWGALYIGAIPFALYPPSLMVNISEYQEKTKKILQQTLPKAIVTISAIRPVLENIVPSAKKTPLLIPKDFERFSESTETFPSTSVSPESTAFLQFTSGSTSMPRGVVLTHQNVMANMEAIIEGSKMTKGDVGISWLPPFHDMGLIGKVLVCAKIGIKLVWMSPQYFLRSPIRWLETISKHGGTMSAAPNFAYSLCLRKVKDKDLARLDLSSWRVALNGAEPVDPGVMKKFIEKFSVCGFKAETMYPVYGLAESSLAVSFPEIGTKPLVDIVNREILGEKKQAVPVSENHSQALSIVSCGKAVPSTKIKIVDENGGLLEDRMVGHILAKGPSICAGYYKNEQASKELLQEGWLKTGDLGYFAGGNLYITGRIKDMIIIRGRNYLPQDIETVVQDIEGVRKGRVVAFSAPDTKNATEFCVVAAEIRFHDEESRERIQEEITKRIQEAIGIRPKKVCLLLAGALPKTSSGKLQRSLTKKLYLANSLEKRCKQNKWKWMLKLVIEWLKSRGNRLVPSFSS